MCRRGAATVTPLFKAVLCLALLFAVSDAFSTLQHRALQQVTTLHAKKKEAGNAKGFGKKIDPPQRAQKDKRDAGVTKDQDIVGLSSFENLSSESFTKPKFEIDPDLPTEQRSKEILRKQYGLRSYEEKQGDVQAAMKAAENQKRLQKIKQMKDEDFDIFMILPPALIRGIDAFLKIGLGVTTVLFVLAGIGITAEAWCVATGNTLPENVDSVIVNVVEPNFTTGLLVLLGFSISLGVFAAAQLGSGSSIYKEEP